MNIVVIDGKNGLTGQLFISKLREKSSDNYITAIGTNAFATDAMLKAGADVGATGENPVVVACRKADVIVGPVAILTADALHGEVTPQMALAVGQSDAMRLLLPVDHTHCNNYVVGVPEMSLEDVTTGAVNWLLKRDAISKFPRV